MIIQFIRTLFALRPEDFCLDAEYEPYREELALALYGSTGASRAFLRIAKRLAGEHIPLGKI